MAGRRLASLMLLLPVLGLAALVGRPRLDLRWEHHPAHFWLVLASALLAAGLAWATGEAAGRRGDARLFHVSLAFLSSAGFLALHALVTPGVLLAEPNLGFAVATPTGVALGSLFALRSTREVAGSQARAEVRSARRLRLALLCLLALWGAASLAGLPPLDAPPSGAESLPALLAAPGAVLYGVAAWRYLRWWRTRGEPVLAAVLAAYLLLAQALVAMAVARSWHLSWWEWHVLLLLAFGLVVGAARRAWHEERFAPLYLEDTSAGRREVSVMFADLQGFTAWSEQHLPEEVSRMLNDQFGAAVPALLRHGGTVDRIVGDALVVTFNSRGDQPDHAERAVRAGLDLQRESRALLGHHPGYPSFRVGINTGPVAVGVLGTHGGRTLTVVGDTVNTAARIESRAPAGAVAVGGSTRAALPGSVPTRQLDDVPLKGKAERVAVHLVLPQPAVAHTADRDTLGEEPP